MNEDLNSILYHQHNYKPFINEHIDFHALKSIYVLCYAVVD